MQQRLRNLFVCACVELVSALLWLFCGERFLNGLSHFKAPSQGFYFSRWNHNPHANLGRSKGQIDPPLNCQFPRCC